ncbi:hypothetical protein MHBO_003294, partial [Bonamia ostreae]
ESLFERIDVLHLNHGILENRFCLEYERGINWLHFQKINQCNYESHVRLLFISLCGLVASKIKPSVAVTCSGGVAGALPFDGSYVAAKSALRAYFSNFRREMCLVGHPINVTIMYPGATDTAFTRDHHGLKTKSVSPENLAKCFVRAVSEQKEEIYFPSNVWIASLIGYFLPSLYNLIVEKVFYLPNRPDCLGRLNEIKETLKKNK